MQETATAITLRGDLVSEATLADVDGSNDWVTVIQFFPHGRSGRDFSDAAVRLCERIGWSSASGPVQVIPVFGLVGDSGRQLHVARIMGLERGTLVGIHQLADLPTAWPQGAPILSQRTFASVAIRHMRDAQRAGDTSTIGLAITDELAAEVTRLLDEQIDSVLALVASAALDHGSQASAERRLSFTELVEARIRVQRARTATRREGVDDSFIAQLDSVIEALDSAASALVGIASAVAAERFAEADSAEQARNRRITLVATALLLPALFFALLGINWIPTRGLQEWWIFIAVLAVGAILACMGWWIGKLIVAPSRKPASANREDIANNKRGL